MKVRELLADDLWPLVSKLSPSERQRLAELALQPAQDAESGPAGDDRYPLRGQPISYEDPTGPVAVEDWGSLR
jgi:hypothetical protein